MTQMGRVGVTGKTVRDGKGDFSAERRLLWIAALAIVVGAICALVAVLLMWLIGFFTNLFYYHDLSVAFRSPTEAAASPWAIVNPIIGGLIIGLMARYGSERIRGHGIPEAMEAILIGQSRMQPKVAVLKPLSSAISIGSGGPFGAEGPIIMTGGACGSIIAQAFNMTSAERKTLLVAGAAGGMSATFATPLAALLLAIELLLFEWKPRSVIPVALASATAALIRPFLVGPGPLFPPAEMHARLPVEVLLCSVLVGLAAGALALLLTLAVYGAEDAFARLPLHWMWWPAIGGLVVGIGGYFEPRALGVGYDIIEDLLQGKYIAQTLWTLILVKAVIWAIALGSGTSGGVLAPLLIMGGALGAMEAQLLPHGDRALWPLVSMAAALGGTMRCPLTAIIFALELTHDIETLPALLIASTCAYAFTVLSMRRSILTEKVARRGYHVSREYAVDPLEILSVNDVLTSDVVTVPASLPLRELMTKFVVGRSLRPAQSQDIALADGAPSANGPEDATAAASKAYQAYPVVDGEGRLLGIVTKSDLLAHWMTAYLEPAGGLDFGPIVAYDLIGRAPLVAYPWETCRTAAQRMAEAGVGRLLVVAAEEPQRLIGILSRSDLLKAHFRLSEEESKREKFFGRRQEQARLPST